MVKGEEEVEAGRGMERGYRQGKEVEVRRRERGRGGRETDRQTD